MKQISTKHISSMAAVIATLLLPLSGFGQTVIGSWQTSSDDGWIDWGNQGVGLFDPSNSNKYSLATSVVSGFGQSLQITKSGWNQNLSIKLQNNGYVDDFENNHLLSFTFSVPDAASAGSTAGYSQMFSVAINTAGTGFYGVPWDSGLWSYSGDTGGNQSGMPNFYFYAGAAARSQTVTLDYSTLLPTIGPSPGYVEIIFNSNNGGGAPDYFYMNEVVLAPEPSSLALMTTGVIGLLALHRRRSQ